MERRVLKPFKDKDTKKVYYKGSKYDSEDKNRINELVKKGYLDGKAIKSLKEAQKEVKEKTTDYDSLTMPELKNAADEKGLEVKGTGKDGALKKEDYVKALEK